MAGTAAGPAPPHRSGAVRRAAARLWTTAGRLLPALLAVNVVEGAVRLAAQAFIAVLPLLMAVAAFAPRSVQELLADSVSTVLGVRGDTLEEVRRTFHATGTTRDTAGAAGLVLTLVSATAFSRALQAVCERCWSLPRAPVRAAAWRWLLWLVVWLAVLLVQAPLRGGFGTGVVSGLVLSLLSATLLWWWTQHLLLGGRVDWRSLLPGSVLAGAGSVALSRVAELMMPTAMRRSFDEFGPLGPVFTFLSWLIAVFLVAVTGLALGRWIAASAWFAALHPPRVRPPGTGVRTMKAVGDGRRASARDGGAT
ncbi:YhjD/YihY/BrkB family envelope integrity protein [Streptomyces echinoruber]|uniref:Uncharacterized protein n=1 Tax=Streptomyces echinoruber TaxID=68898 RepID=A0A918R478_9ACTN|nr:YhjD/YihY/BrkB family envelope integrity protein [Streptomyces echinoruber]GGZ84073.1 hypothetical protein GCM10010389_22740 [Streptomyces echinoruber]